MGRRGNLGESAHNVTVRKLDAGYRAKKKKEIYKNKHQKRLYIRNEIFVQKTVYGKRERESRD